VRVVIADDSMLLREGLARLLTDSGIEVVGTAVDAPMLMELVRQQPPDVALVDIKMPPTHTEEGLVAAQTIRHDYPEVGVLVLSQYLAPEYALRLLSDVPERVGYLLKERVTDVAVLVDALHRICDGECVVDPTIVRRLIQRPRRNDPVSELTDREREVLSLMAEGRSNAAIGRLLYLSGKTVEAHIRQIFVRLGLEPSGDDHRRVLAVLALLRSTGREQS
jgi:DNA-binding NarL/FixJ family response regulator